MHIYREHPFENHKVRAFTDNKFEFAPHWHTQIEIVTVISGSLEAKVSGNKYYLNEGDILFCSTNEIHSYFNSTGRSMFLMIKPSFIENSSKILQNHKLKQNLIKSDQVSNEIKNLFDIIMKNYCNNKGPRDEINSLVFHGYALALLGNLLSEFEFESGTQKIKLNMYDYMRNAFEYIDEHCCENDLNLKKIAAHIGVSPCYFSRSFKIYSGYALTEYINRKRIEKAEVLLAENEKSITEISLECGYGSLRNFNRVYKELTGKTPKEVRDSNFIWTEKHIERDDLNNHNQ